MPLNVNTATPQELYKFIPRVEKNDVLTLMEIKRKYGKITKAQFLEVTDMKPDESFLDFLEFEVPVTVQDSQLEEEKDYLARAKAPDFDSIRFTPTEQKYSLPSQASVDKDVAKFRECLELAQLQRRVDNLSGGLTFCQPDNKEKSQKGAESEEYRLDSALKSPKLS